MTSEPRQDTLISADDVAAMMGVSKRTFWRMIKWPSAPQSVRLTYKTVRWSKAEVEQWIQILRERNSHE